MKSDLIAPQFTTSLYITSHHITSHLAGWIQVVGAQCAVLDSARLLWTRRGSTVVYFHADGANYSAQGVFECMYV